MGQWVGPARSVRRAPLLFIGIQRCRALWKGSRMSVGEILGYVESLLGDLGFVSAIGALIVIMVAISVVRRLFDR